MSITLKQLTSYFLLLCLSATLVPFHAFHKHEAPEICEETHAKQSVSLCHITAYHLDTGETTGCRHESHLNTLEKDCELCQFVNNQRFDFDFDQNQFESKISFDQDFPQYENSYVLTSTVNAVLGRAPPAS